MGEVNPESLNTAGGSPRFEAGYPRLGYLLIDGPSFVPYVDVVGGAECHA